jgi:hypothetical protein
VNKFGRPIVSVYLSIVLLALLGVQHSAWVQPPVKPKLQPGCSLPRQSLNYRDDGRSLPLAGHSRSVDCLYGMPLSISYPCIPRIISALSILRIGYRECGHFCRIEFVLTVTARNPRYSEQSRPVLSKSAMLPKSVTVSAPSLALLENAILISQGAEAASPILHIFKMVN